MKSLFNRKNLANDLPASLAVFLVAVPLCVGIAQASGAPPLSGLLAGLIGGIVVGSLSGSDLSVSGPAAGLTAVVAAGISDIGSFEGFLVAVVLGGLIQLALGGLKLGFVAGYFPTAVIKGMLSAIGLILIFKQLPHLIGYDIERFGVEEFLLSPNDLIANKYPELAGQEDNTFTLLLHAFSHINLIALGLGMLSLLIIIGWERQLGKRLPWIPASLMAVLIGAVLNALLLQFAPDKGLQAEHLVSIPDLGNQGLTALMHPDWSVLTNPSIYVLGITIALVASIETLLSVEAVDRLDPQGRVSSKDRELLAQGAGNTLSGLVGGLPITAVIVRSSVNLAAGARSRISAIVHGFLILLAIFALAGLINMIPKASLAAVLVVVGFKLASPKVFLAHYHKGIDQLVPLVVTIVAILLTDLLIGVGIGVLTAILFTLWRHLLVLHVKSVQHGNTLQLTLSQELSFLHKARLQRLLNDVQPGTHVRIDATQTELVDFDVLETLRDFQERAPERNIRVEIDGLDTKKLDQSFAMSQLLQPSWQKADEPADAQSSEDDDSGARP